MKNLFKFAMTLALSGLFTTSLFAGSFQQQGQSDFYQQQPPQMYPQDYGPVMAPAPVRNISCLDIAHQIISRGGFVGDGEYNLNGYEKIKIKIKNGKVKCKIK